jgi:hypothetical protein
MCSLLAFASQLIFFGDPILSLVSTPMGRKKHADENGGMLATGVERTYILSLISGSDESYESVRFVFDSQIDLDELKKLCNNAEIVAPVDMKMGNKMAGSSKQTHVPCRCQIGYNGKKRLFTKIQYQLSRKILSQNKFNF